MYYVVAQGQSLYVNGKEEEAEDSIVEVVPLAQPTVSELNPAGDGVPGLLDAFDDSE